MKTHIYTVIFTSNALHSPKSAEAAGDKLDHVLLYVLNLPAEPQLYTAIKITESGGGVRSLGEDEGTKEGAGHAALSQRISLSILSWLAPAPPQSKHLALTPLPTQTHKNGQPVTQSTETRKVLKPDVLFCPPHSWPAGGRSEHQVLHKASLRLVRGREPRLPVRNITVTLWHVSTNSVEFKRERNYFTHGGWTSRRNVTEEAPASENAIHNCRRVCSDTAAAPRRFITATEPKSIYCTHSCTGQPLGVGYPAWGTQVK